MSNTIKCSRASDDAALLDALLPQRAADVKEQVHELHAEDVVGELVGVAHPKGKLLLDGVERAPGA